MNKLSKERFEEAKNHHSCKCELCQEFNELVIRTLAEFMGVTGEIRFNRLKTHMFVVDEEGGWTSLDYLESYDPVAQVWLKMHTFCDSSVIRGYKILMEAKDAILDWYKHKPRVHAYSLAWAILQNQSE